MATSASFLLKPIDYPLTCWLCLFEFSEPFDLSPGFTAVPPGNLHFLLATIFCLSPDPTALGWFFASVTHETAAAPNFFTSYVMAMLAFWVLGVSTFIFILFAF